LNDEMLKTNPNDPDALVYKGQILLRQGRATDAADTLQQVLHNDPNNAVAHYHLGVAFEQMGNLGRAENEWREAVRLRPDLMDAYKTLAASDLRRNAWDSLARDADPIITLQAALPDGYALRAISEMNRNQGDKALADLRKAIEVAPQSPVGYIHLGNFYRRQNKYKDAENFYEQALQRDPNAADALGGIVELNILQKQPEKAVARVQQQLKAQPTNSNYHYLLGALLFNNQDLKNAEAELNRAVEIDKTNGDAVLKLGQVQVARGAGDQAIKTYQTYLQNNPRNANFLIVLGQLYETLHKWEDAKQTYQKALQIQPDNPLASNNLAYVMLQEGGNVDVALSMAQTARRGNPSSANYADTLGWAYYKKGAYASAVDLFKEAIKLNKDNPDDPDFHYHLGLAYQKTSQPALAKQQFERALKINPGFSNAEDAKKLLAELR